jgi:hypothetical protein
MEDMVDLRSVFLFAMPSGIEGAGRLLDLAGTMTEYNEARGPQEADAIAIAMDWLTVGDDLRNECLKVVPEEVRLRIQNEVAAR